MSKDRTPARPGSNRRAGIPTGKAGKAGKAPKGEADPKQRAPKLNDSGYGRGSNKPPRAK